MKILNKILLAQISLMSLTSSIFAADSGMWTKLNDEASGAKAMFSSNDSTLDGPLALAVKFLVMFIGVIILGMGIHETFIAEDKGGEGKKTKGLLKMIGGALFIAIMPFISWINSAQ